MLYKYHILIQPISNLFDRHPYLVCSRTIGESFYYPLTFWFCFHTIIKNHLRINDIMIFIFISCCNFSPSRIPISGILHPGSIACAKSVILKEGILLIKVSPPRASFNALNTNSTPSGRLIQNLVIL